MVAKFFSLEKVEALKEYEIKTFANPKEGLSVRIDKFANYMGRQWGIGRIAGAIRFATGAILAASRFAAIFLLLGAGIAYPIDHQAFNVTLAYSVMYGLHTVEGILQSARGLLETIQL